MTPTRRQLATLILAGLCAVLTACQHTPTPSPPSAATSEPTLAPLPYVRVTPEPSPTAAAPRSPLDLSRLPRWTRGDVINMLALGVDRRESEIPRSDTMLLASVDLSTKQVRVVSIPRDLIVEIQGLGQDRINAAFSLGEQERPGSGPLRTKQVVEQNFRVSIAHWAVIDFQCFRTAIDAVGGIYVEIPNRIVDEEYPDDSYGTMPITFEPGFQWLDGERALQYARTRHGDSDFGRMRRQQQVLSALRSQLLTLNQLPVLPTVLDGCRGFSSDISLIDLVSLAFTARGIPESNIRLGIIDERMARPTITPAGASVLSPDWPTIRSLVRDLFPGMARG